MRRRREAANVRPSDMVVRTLCSGTVYFHLPFEASSRSGSIPIRTHTHTHRLAAFGISHGHGRVEPHTRDVIQPSRALNLEIPFPSVAVLRNDFELSLFPRAPLSALLS